MPLLFPNEQRSDALPRWQRWPDAAQMLPRRCPDAAQVAWLRKFASQLAYASLIFQMALKPHTHKIRSVVVTPAKFLHVHDICNDCNCRRDD